ncbi:MAG: hypothetical protein K1X79_11145 [Oligoflexia bacterium]|nr:hypothetical protein [Oligoflexia bacterium]
MKTSRIILALIAIVMLGTGALAPSSSYALPTACKKVAAAYKEAKRKKQPKRLDAIRKSKAFGRCKSRILGKSNSAGSLA